MVLFLKWWLFVSLVSVGIIYGAWLGVAEAVWKNDATKLSFAIFALFVGMTLWCGWKTWQCAAIIRSGQRLTAGGGALSPPDRGRRLARLRQLEEAGWFASELCLNLGMIGTVSGFIMMLHGFTVANISEIDAIKELLASMSSGMSTALYTTLTGLICSQTLKIQYFNLAGGLESLKETTAAQAPEA